jgi:release factor glutamine methyltransferase
MTCGEWLQHAMKYLTKAGIGTAHLDALVLLEDAAGHDRAWLLAHPEHKLAAKTIAHLNRQLKQRSTFIPLSYIRGKTEFFGREFMINADVLEPRPESETMIELLKKLSSAGSFGDSPQIFDIGTGSGALGITAKLELVGSTAVLIDIDPHCLAIAKRNAENLGAEVILKHSDLLSEIEPVTRPAVVLANLPYVPNGYRINQAALHEPRLAIFGGTDGLDLYRALFGQLAARPDHIKWVLTESLPPQHPDLARIARSAGYGLEAREDFIQLFVRH